MRSIVSFLSTRLKVAGATLATLGLAVAGLVVLPSTPAFADTVTSTISTPVLITSGAWPDHMLCASQWDNSVWLQQNNGANPYCQWEEIGDGSKFALYNPQKRKVMAYEGGDAGPLVMQDVEYPTPNQQYFSWGGREDWGAYALQSYLDSGQNVDAMDPHSDTARTDAVHTRGWRHGYQRELTWNAVPVSANTSLSQAAAELQSYDTYLAGDLGSTAPNETDCVTVTTPIRSAANGQYVSAELGYTGDQYGMLRARAGAVGPWEQYNLCRNTTTNTYAIRSSNGQYVSAELGYTGDQYGMLRARAGAVGPWEQFTFEPAANGYAIRSAANGQYVSAELGYTGDQYGMLRARAGAVGPWEQFQ
ncbi:fascin domain-containing protein [Kitasatospora kifunensis]|uniref:Uncharacterized protein n=1 Tax=Kitasatospora kifunensis TaxID=58351 RepID=A0A7W7VZM5_KITKI|nr:hypothetical protein [Kitasatospora kifunensis]MBB4927884.1 hypothetical protein [Kitasatospora kifunensis]